MKNTKNIFLNTKSPNFYEENNSIFSFPYDSIEFKGKMHDDFEFEYNYYMSIKVSDMLFDLRKEAGLDTKDGVSIGTEEGSWYHLGGNVLGQWLQAYARFYASTKREEVLLKAKELVSGFKEISDVNHELFDGLVMYFFEKYLRGFTDCYVLCGIEDALIIAKRLIESAMKSNIYQNPELLLGNNGPGYEIEWYTIPESILYFADVYRRSTNNNVDLYYDFAKKFAYYSYWNIFVSDDDFYDYTPLGGQNTGHFHAYSHLNTLNSCAYLYNITKDKYYFDAIKKCYDWFKKEQALPTGAYGTHIEWLLPKTGIINAIKNYHDSFETQCNSYAVYRVGNYLLTSTKEAKYADWSERLIFNATLASAHIDKCGHAFYYSDYNTKESKKFLHDNTWTCCTGSRPLLMNELRRSVYFYDVESIYIAQFISSKINLNGLIVDMDVDYKKEMIVNINIKTNNTNIKYIKIRKPEWVKDNFKVSSNYEISNGWIVVDISNKTIEVKYPLKVEVDVIDSKGDGIASLRVGPIVLASSTGLDIKLNLLEEYKDLKYVSPLHYESHNGSIKWKPFMEFNLGEPYHMFYSLREYLKKEEKV